jgi:hypothetical protein
LWQ